jgi:regulator of sigma E protease
VYKVHYEYPVYLDQPVNLAWVEKDSPAAKAGLQAGDRVIRIDGLQNPTWEQLDPKVMLSPNQPLSLTVKRGDQTFDTTVTPEAVGVSQMGYVGWVQDQPNIVTDLEPGMPAEKAGIKEGDEITAVDGKPVPAIAAMIEMLKQSKSKPIDVRVRRNGKELTFHVQPVLADVEGLKEERYRIGIQSIPMKVTTLPLAEAFQRSIDQNRKASLLILELVQKMVQGKISPRSVEGPIRIGQAAGQAASEKGWTPLMELTAAISLNLGIFNLLPIPILDGGVIMLLLIEGVMRRDINLRIKERIYQAAFVFLVLFAVMVIYNDLLKTLPGLAQRLP